MGGCFERRGLREEREKKKSKVLQGASSMSKFFSISYAWLFIFPRWTWRSPPLLCADVFRATPGPLRHLRPLAKRRTYWLS